jgi:diaminopimelate decarboxylase
MASNYNYLLKPPVVAVRDGVATELVRRQTLSDVFAERLEDDGGASIAASASERGAERARSRE